MRRLPIAVLMAALAVVLVPSVSAYTVKVAVVADEACGDVVPQSEGDRELFLESYRAGGGSVEDDLSLLDPVYADLPNELVTSMAELWTTMAPAADDIRTLLGVGFVRFYAPFPGGDSHARGGHYHSVVTCAYGANLAAGAHEDGHVLDPDDDPALYHEWAYINPEAGEYGIDANLSDFGSCPGCRRVARMSAANVARVAEGFRMLAGTFPPPPIPDGWVVTSAIPGFGFQFRITPAGGAPSPAQLAGCFAETLCVSGAVPKRGEAYLKIIGPRPNGFLWVQIARFTPSQVEFWVLSQKTGQINYYNLEPVGPEGSNVSGLQDREAFLP